MYCEIVGNVDNHHYPIPCIKAAKHRVSVTGLPSVHVCDEHVVEMKEYWKNHTVAIIRIMESNDAT